MTGHGEAQRRSEAAAVGVEVRTVNNRYFKLVFRAEEPYGALESRVEEAVRRRVRRGTVQVHLTVDRRPSPEDYRLNEVALASYRRQLERLCEQLHIREPLRLDALLNLPGVVEDAERAGADPADLWPLVQPALEEALERLLAMRREEGRAMAADLERNLEAIAKQAEAIAARAPAVAEAYQKRLTERLNRLLQQHDAAVEPADIVREVGVFAERCDISEELVRLRSHLDQFRDVMGAERSAGRKLEFLSQEMFREANTIGSKANDAEIARRVVDIKAAIERIREMAQNVE